jgi:hypothetical protein
MKYEHDGGPAFPVSENVPLADEGMRLRDHFAAMSMMGLQANSEISVGPNEPDSEGDREWAGTCARSAYLLADAMLEARGAEGAHRGPKAMTLLGEFKCWYEQCHVAFYNDKDLYAHYLDVCVALDLKPMFAWDGEYNAARPVPGTIVNAETPRENGGAA